MIRSLFLKALLALNAHALKHIELSSILAILLTHIIISVLNDPLVHWVFLTLVITQFLQLLNWLLVVGLLFGVLLSVKVVIIH